MISTADSKMDEISQQLRPIHKIMTRIYIWREKSSDKDIQDAYTSLQNLKLPIQNLHHTVQELVNPLTEPYATKCLEKLSIIEKLLQATLDKLDQRNYLEACSTWGNVESVFVIDVEHYLKIIKRLKEIPENEDLIAIDLTISSHDSDDMRLLNQLNMYKSANKADVIAKDTGTAFLGGGFIWAATTIAVGANILTIIKFLGKWWRNQKKRGKPSVASPNKKSAKIVLRTKAGKITIEDLSEESIRKLVEIFLEKA